MAKSPTKPKAPTSRRKANAGETMDSATVVIEGIQHGRLLDMGNTELLGKVAPFLRANPNCTKPVTVTLQVKVSNADDSPAGRHQLNVVAGVKTAYPQITIEDTGEMTDDGRMVIGAIDTESTDPNQLALGEGDTDSPPDDAGATNVHDA